jgi:hypothetical protein
MTVEFFEKPIKLAETVDLQGMCQTIILCKKSR